MRPVLIVLAAVIIAGIAYHAFPATDPNIEQPTIRLQKPTDSKSRCLQSMTVRRFMITSQGEYQYAGGYTVWQACDR